jgi:hypothetical protein
MGGVIIIISSQMLTNPNKKESQKKYLVTRKWFSNLKTLKANQLRTINLFCDILEILYFQFVILSKPSGNGSTAQIETAQNKQSTQK